MNRVRCGIGARTVAVHLGDRAGSGALVPCLGAGKVACVDGLLESLTSAIMQPIPTGCCLGATAVRVLEVRMAERPRLTRGKQAYIV